MVYTKRLAEIAAPYNIKYDYNFEAWRRFSGERKKKFEIGKITEEMVGENIMRNKLNYVRYYDDDLILEESDDGVLVCICGEDTCHSLSKLYHSGTNEAFLVGSKCISLAEGQEDYINKKNCAKKNGLCDECKEPIVLRGKNKNKTTKNISRIWFRLNLNQYMINLTEKLCDNCCGIAYKKQNEIKQIKETRLKREREAEEVKNKIKKDPKNKHLLNISYDDKDKYKLEFGTLWDPKIKKWYWIGLIEEIPDEIKPLLIKDVHMV
jgi:hypothetical protein